eukprot:4447219-Alexandrium_andersonii.AAC.1
MLLAPIKQFFVQAEVASATGGMATGRSHVYKRTLLHRLGMLLVPAKHLFCQASIASAMGRVANG